MEITCPSGLQGEIRGLKVRELALLNDVKLIRHGKLLNEIVRNCWVRTTAVGPYPLAGLSGGLPWESMLHVDRMVAFKEIRIKTYGPEFEWEVKCPQCDHHFIRVVDLSALTASPLPATSLTHIKTGQPFYANCAGRKVTFRLLRAGDDERIIKYTRDLNMSVVTASILCRIMSVEGVEEGDPVALAAWIDDLDLDDCSELTDTMDKQESILETTVETACTKCDHTWTGAIPLIQALSSGKRKKKQDSDSMKRSSSSTETLSPSVGKDPLPADPT